LIGFFGPHGPSSLETQGLLTSITPFEQEIVNNAKIKTNFFMISKIFCETKNLIRFLQAGKSQI